MWQKVRPVYSAESTQGFLMEAEKDLENETNPSSEICKSCECTQHPLIGSCLRPLRADLFQFLRFFRPKARYQQVGLLITYEPKN